VDALIFLREVAVPVGLGPLRQWLAGFRRPSPSSAGFPAVAGALGRDAATPSASLSVSFSLPPRDLDAAAGLFRGERADLDVRTVAVAVGELAEELQVTPFAPFAPCPLLSRSPSPPAGTGADCLPCAHQHTKAWFPSFI